MRAALVAAATCGVLGMAIVVACNKDGAISPDGEQANGARSACSTGPAYVSAGQFEAGTAVLGDVPQCIPRCGETAPAIAAVPSGACTVPNETCNIDVQSPGCDDELQCKCTNGQWGCVITLDNLCAVDAAAVD